MKVFLVTAVAVAVALNARAEPEIKGAPAELGAYLANLPKPVVITVEGEAKAPADKAIITIRVVTEGKGLQPTIKANQEAKIRFISFLAERGVAGDQIQGSRFSSTPKYGLFSDKAKSYRVDNQLTVTVRDDKEFQAVALGVDSIPEIRYAGIDFELSDKESLKGRAIAQACERVLAEKRTYEEKLGVKLMPKRFFTIVNPSPADLNRVAPLESERSPGTRTVTGIMSDPAFRTTIHALEQREEPAGLFGEVSARVLISFEFALETR